MEQQIDVSLSLSFKSINKICICVYICNIKNTLEGIDSRLDKKDQISDLKDKVTQNTQSKQKKIIQKLEEFKKILGQH